MFIDTSAIVAILADEPEATRLADALSKAKRRFTSPVVRLETTIILASKLAIAPAQAQALFDEFIEEAEVSIVPVYDKIGRLAVDAFDKFGKGRHPAKLNFADCLSYAGAKANRARLLFKGDDFSKTDIAPAIKSAT